MTVSLIFKGCATLYDQLKCLFIITKNDNKNKKPKYNSRLMTHNGIYYSYYLGQNNIHRQMFPNLLITL